MLQVSKWGSKSWIFRYERAGRDRHMGLGSLQTLTLAEARDKARQCRKQLLEGVDPIDARAAGKADSRLEAARGITFKGCAEKYITAHEKSWRNEKHRAQWRSTLSTYAYPVIGELPVSKIDTALVVKVVEPLWHAKPGNSGSGARQDRKRPGLGKGQRLQARRESRPVEGPPR
ncbi:MAG TPA: Arm DNA-binding domain-containing protein [Bradyrhizobium sp.]|nr:Arm DNA-binding domain-containing protein [Bradyrhizobium sp.]